jgi:hypothetical protein
VSSKRAKRDDQKRGRKEQRTRPFNVRKKDFQRLQDQCKQSKPGHVCFKKGAGFDQADENSLVTVTEMHTNELGQHRSLFNEHFQNIMKCRADDNKTGWYSSIANKINSMRQEQSDMARSYLAALPDEPSGTLNDMTVVMTNFPEDDHDEVGEIHSV